MTQPFYVFMQAGGGGRDACSISASFLFSRANGTEEPLEKLAPSPHHSRFPGQIGQTRWRRPIPLPWHGFGPSQPAEMMAQGKPFLGHWHCLWLTPSVRCSQSPAVLPPKTQCGACVHAAHCICHRSALRMPMQRRAFFVLPWVGSSGSAFRPRPDAAASLLGMHGDELGTRLR